MQYTIRKFRAFLNGLREARLTYTTHYDDLGLSEAYDKGRGLFHAITWGYYDPC